MVCESPDELAALAAGTVPFGCERYTERDGQPILVRKQVILTGENLNDAQAGFDSQTQEPAVHLNLDARGARIFRDVTRENVGKRMAILLIERGKGEVVTAPVIRTEIGGGRVQISGRMTSQEANDTSQIVLQSFQRTGAATRGRPLRFIQCPCLECSHEISLAACCTDHIRQVDARLDGWAATERRRPERRDSPERTVLSGSLF